MNKSSKISLFKIPRELRIAISFFSIFFISLFAHSQSEVLSLIKKVHAAEHDSTKIKLYLDLGYEYEYINSDTAILYYNEALVLAKATNNRIQKAKALMYIGIVFGDKGNYPRAIEFYTKSLKLNSKIAESEVKSEEIAGKTGMLNCYGNIGNIDITQGNYKNAVANFEKQLQLSKEVENQKKISNSLRSLGTVCVYQGKYEKAMGYYQKSLKIDDEIGNIYGVVSNYGNIGTVLTKQENYPQAIEYLDKQLDLSREIGDKRGEYRCYGSLGNVYSLKDDHVEAIESYKKALEICSELGDQSGMAYCYGNIGIAYNRLGKTKQAEEYTEKSIKIKEELGDKNGIASSLEQMAWQYISLAKAATLPKVKILYLTEAIKYGKRAMKIAEEIKAFPSINSASYKLQIAYTDLGKYKDALYYANVFISSKDSMFSEQKTKALAEMTARYEAEKKQLQIEKMEQQKELDNKTIEAQHAKNKKQLYIIISALFVLAIVLVFSIIMVRMFRQKRMANVLLSEQKLEISDKNEELNQQAEELLLLNENLHQQNEEITTQRDEIESQKDIIEEIYHHVEESINYATRLQKSILPDMKLLTKHFTEHFVFFKPKDKVSGDFYWWTHIENHTVITAADSTGHGVPGAFMSMLGVSFLREIVQKEYITHPGVILRKLRKEIIKALKQKGETGEQKDGMDMALISVNHETNLIQFAGANNPLYIISNNKIEGLENIEGLIENPSKYFYEIKPDKMPIAIYEKMDKFKTHEVQLSKGDQIFMFSDGFPDQFGGPKGKKFKYKPFKRLLLENAVKPLVEQQQILEQTFDSWKGKLEQIDDVVVVSLVI